MDTGKKEDPTEPEEPTETNYSLTFNANGGIFTHEDGGTITDTTLTVKSKNATELFDVIMTTYHLYYKEFGYDLIGWAWSSDATEADYIAGDKVTLTKANPVRTLYAVWKEHKTTFRLIFDGNGENVTGVPEALTFESGDSAHEFTVPEAKEIKNGEYVFKGWADTKDVKTLDDIKYQAGDKIRVTETSPVKTIYAVWGTPTGVIVPPPATGETW